MRELSLFSGAGGGLLATTHLLGFTTIGYVEWDKYCQRVIRQRIDDGLLESAPIFGDVREFAQSGFADQYNGFTDLVTAGFPCQPFSVAGNQKASDDERNMWPATIDIIRRVQPAYVFLENVPGLLSSGTWDVENASDAIIPPAGYFGRVLGDLAEAGFDVAWCVLGAADIGGFHRRNRVWVLATNSTRKSCNGSKLEFNLDQSKQKSKPRDATCKSATNAHRAGLKKRDSTKIPAEPRYITRGGYALDAAAGGELAVGENIPEPVVCGMANDVADRVGRIKAAGNGQVPHVAAAAFRLLKSILEEGAA